QRRRIRRKGGRQGGAEGCRREPEVSGDEDVTGVLCHDGTSLRLMARQGPALRRVEVGFRPAWRADRFCQMCVVRRSDDRWRATVSAVSSHPSWIGPTTALVTVTVAVFTVWVPTSRAATTAARVDMTRSAVASSSANTSSWNRGSCRYPPVSSMGPPAVLATRTAGHTFAAGSLL